MSSRKLLKYAWEDGSLHCLTGDCGDCFQAYTIGFHCCECSVPSYRPLNPGDRVHHKCSDPYCPLYGTVVSVLSPDPDGGTTVWVKWDPFRGVESEITENTPPMPLRLDSLEPYRPSN